MKKISKEKKYIKSFYDKNAQSWVSFKTNSFYHEKPFRLFEKLLKKDSTVLDIGCAGGIHLPLFLGIGDKLKYEGIDVSKKMIEIARARYPRNKFHVSGIEDFNSNKKFDAFWAAAILMHFNKNEITSVFKNMHSITKNKAIGYLTLPNKRPNEESLTDKRLFSIYTKKEISEILKNSGWSILYSGKNPDPRPGFAWSWYIVQKIK